MSHEHELHPDYAGPVPEDPRPPRVTGLNPPPPQPSAWVEPTVTPATDEPVASSDEPVVIAEDDEGPPLLGPRSRRASPTAGWGDRLRSRVSGWEDSAPAVQGTAITPWGPNDGEVPGGSWVHRA